jgi:hypothetical protein
MRTSKGKKSSSPRRRSSEARALRALPSKVIPNKKRMAELRRDVMQRYTHTLKRLGEDSDG